MNSTFYCPFCTLALTADTDSGEEFSCSCGALVDVLDHDLTMVSLPPHADIQFVPTCELQVREIISA